MARGLDHIVHAVRDLDAAADFYRRAGFVVGARNRHAWGTHNHVVQLPGFFIEILTVAEPEKLGADGLSQQFGIFNRDAIARGEGFSMLMLESVDAEADAADFARTNIGCSPALPFSREAKLADGSTTTVGFTLAFARAASSPHAGFAVCRQRNPGAFWNPAFQNHHNGASGLNGVVLLAADPAAHQGFVSALTGVVAQVTPAGTVARTPRGEVEVIDAAAFNDRFGIALWPDGAGLRLVGLRLMVRDLAVLDAQLSRNAITAHRRPGRIVLSPDAALGAALIFEEGPRT